MKVVHVQTTVQTVFGVLDDEGDVVKKQPVNLELGKLNQKEMMEALEKLNKIKDELGKQQ